MYMDISYIFSIYILYICIYNIFLYIEYINIFSCIYFAYYISYTLSSILCIYFNKIYLAYIYIKIQHIQIYIRPFASQITSGRLFQSLACSRALIGIVGQSGDQSRPQCFFEALFGLSFSAPSFVGQLFARPRSGFALKLKSHYLIVGSKAPLSGEMLNKVEHNKLTKWTQGGNHHGFTLLWLVEEN